MSDKLIQPIDIGGTPLDIEHFLGADYTDIRLASEELPAVIEWVNSELQSAIALRITSKFAIKKCEASAYFDLKNGGFERAGYGDKMTEKSLEHAVNLDKAVDKAVTEYANSTAWASRLSNLINSLQAKLDLVRSAEATSRRLIDTDEARDRENEN